MTRNKGEQKEKEKMIRRTFTFPEQLYKELETLANEEYDCNNSLALRVAIRDLIKKSQRRKQHNKTEKAAVDS